MHRLRCAANARGATFIEIIIAVFIIAVAGSGIVAAHLSAEHLSEQATDTMQAVNDLEDLLEHVRSTPFANLQAVFPAGVANGGAGAPTPYERLVGPYTLDGESITVTYPQVSPGRIELLVTANWSFRGRALTTNISTARTS